jgi:Na+/H+ antiporter NhaD/arsenite permease-like protein
MVLVVVILLLPLLLDMFILNAYDAKRENEKDRKEKRKDERNKKGRHTYEKGKAFLLLVVVGFFSILQLTTSTSSTC